MHTEITRTLEKIGSREKYINSQMEGQLTEYRHLQDKYVTRVTTVVTMVTMITMVTMVNMIMMVTMVTMIMMVTVVTVVS